MTRITQSELDKATIYIIILKSTKSKNVGVTKNVLQDINFDMNHPSVFHLGIFPFSLYLPLRASRWPSVSARLLSGKRKNHKHLVTNMLPVWIFFCQL